MYLMFTFDGAREFMMDGAKVFEVLPAGEIFQAPRQRKEVLGIIRHRDMLIPVYDFRLLLPELFPASSFSPPHLILFYGAESMNAFLAEAMESVTADCLMADVPLVSPFLEPQEVLHEDRSYARLNFTAIEAFLNIP